MSSLSLSARREHGDDGGAVTLSLDGDLDLATVPTLRDSALSELAEPSCRTLVLDLAGLTFVDSTGIGCWIDLRNHAEELGKDLRLEAVPAAARRTVTIAGLAPVFGIDEA